MRWRDELDALSFESVSRIIAGGILLGGLIGAGLVGTGVVGGDDEPIASTTEAPEGSPVCVRGAAGSAGATTLAAALSARFAVAGERVGTGWPRRVDGAWRWDRTSNEPDGQQPEVGEPVVDARGRAWAWLRYDLAAGSSANAATRTVRLAVPVDYLADGPPRGELPDPEDPGSLPPGSTMLLTSADDPGGGEVLAITPLTDTRVAVSIGAAAVVERVALVFPGTADVQAELPPTDELPSYTLRQTVLDLGSADGPELYDQALAGSFPAADRPGQEARAEIFGGSDASARAADLRTGGLAVPQSFLAPGVRRTIREDADGTLTLTRILDGRAALRFAEELVEGRVRTVEATIGVSAADSVTASRFNRAYAGSPAEVSGPVDLLLVVDVQDLTRVRDDALWIVTDWLASTVEGRRLARDVVGLDGLATRDAVDAWVARAQPTALGRVVAVLGGESSAPTERAAAAVLAAGPVPEPWAVYSAFAGTLAGGQADAAGALAEWGDAVSRATRTPYRGPGVTSCTAAGPG